MGESGFGLPGQRGISGYEITCVFWAMRTRVELCYRGRDGLYMTGSFL